MNEQLIALLSSEDLSQEIQESRRSLFNALFPSTVVLAWIWLYYALARQLDPFTSAVPFLIASLGAYVAWRISDRNLYAACCLLEGALVWAVAMLVAAYPFTSAPILGAIVIVIANAMTPGAATVVVAALTWASITLALRFATATSWWVGQSAQLAIVYTLTLAAAWLSTKPIKRSMDQALSGWAQARNAMLQMRQQRGELYRTVRLLEEANYRIERVNHDLAVAQREAEAARQLKAQFAATVSHELRGPLNLILGFSRLMCLSPESYPVPLPQAYRADIYTIYRSCQHLLALVDDILDLSQMDAAQLPLVKDRTDLDADVCQRCVDLMRPLAERKGLVLEYQVTGSLPWVLADAVRLRQALLNVLTNAVRFTDHGGITVRVESRGENIVIHVADTGPGIAQEDIPKLFRQFSQVHPQPKAGDSGSGLGLAITKHLIELHGGEVWVESQLGRGTTFSLSVPLPESGMAATAPVRTAAATHPFSAPVCLVVHDEPDVIRLLARQMAGFHLTGLPNEADVPTLVNQLAARAVITARQRAEKVLARLRESGLDTPVIHCELPSYRTRYQGGNILGYLVKPIAPEVLAATLGRLDGAEEMTVLIVDDDPETVRLLERMINALPNPYRIVRAYDGQEAMRIMDSSPPDVVLLDSVMPNVSGDQVLEHMWASETLCDVPVVIVSGQDWIDPNLSIGDAIGLQCGHPIPLSQGIDCIRALLSWLPASPLHATAVGPEAPEAVPAEPASSAPPRRRGRSRRRVDPAPSR